MVMKLEKLLQQYMNSTLKNYKGDNMKKYRKLFPIFIVIYVLFISVGFAAFRDNMRVTDISATVTPVKKIQITDFQYRNSTGGSSSTSEWYSYTHTDARMTLPEGSTVTYMVEVSNIGNVDMGILKITGLPSNLQATYTDYTLGEKLCSNDRCNTVVKKQFLITIGYKTGGYNSNQMSYNLSLDYDFESFHNVYYETNNIGYIINGGNKTFNLGSNATDEVEVTGTFGSKTYTKPNLTINNAESDIYITNVSSGGGTGTPSNPYHDSSTETYDPNNIPANSTIVYDIVDGAPKVSTDNNGNVISFEYTNASVSNPVNITSDSPVATGFIPFDGTSDWELNMRYKWSWSQNVGTGSTITTPLSCMDWSNGSLSSGFGIRHNARKATSTTTVPKTNLVLQVSLNDNSTTHYLYNTNSSGRIYTDPMDYSLHITKVGSTITYEMTANGNLKYNPTRDNSSSNGVVTTTNEKITKTWEDNNSTSNVDITICGYLSSSGSISQKANIEVIEFSVHKI